MSRYVNLDYVNNAMTKFEDDSIWSTFDDLFKQKRIEWAESLIDNEEYIGEPESYEYGFAFPRYLINEAVQLGILDTENQEGMARTPIQKQFYHDHLNPAPESIKKAVVQIIKEWIGMQDLQSLLDLQKKANLQSFDVFTWKEPDWKRTLPKPVYDLIAWLKPLTWKDSASESVRLERA